MRLHEIQPIFESRGFVARKPGDEFVDPTNSSDVATFQGLTLLPESGISFPSNNEFLAAYNDWKNIAEGTVYEINKPNRSIASAMIVNMETERGLEHYVLFTKDLGNLPGKLVNIPDGLIPDQGGYVLNKDTSTSERAGLKPAEIIKSEKPVSMGEVAGLLEAGRATAGDVAVDQMQGYLNALVRGNGENYVITDGAANTKLHQKYLGEWAAPIALMTGQFDPKTQLETIQDHMTGGNSVIDGKILFNTNAAEALFDSAVLVGNNYQIFISSKAKTGGAAASLQGLYDIIIKEDSKLPKTFWDNSKAAKFREVILGIMGKSAIEGVLNVAELEEVITPEDKDAILKGMRGERTQTSEFQPTQTLNDYMGDYGANINHPQYSPSKHALASVARQLCKKLNSEDFTSIIKQLLSHANVVQMYFNAAPKGNNLICKGFKLVWPAKFDGKIKFFSGKMFSATSIKGRLGFKIGSGSTMEDEPDESLTAKLPAGVERVIAKKAKKAKELAVGKITKSGEKDVRDTNISDKLALGRAKKV